MSRLPLQHLDLEEDNEDQTDFTPEVSTTELLEALASVTEVIDDINGTAYRTDTINEYGFVQTVDEDGYPVCSQCGCCVMPNRGEGTLCSMCAHEFLMHCEADY